MNQKAIEHAKAFLTFIMNHMFYLVTVLTLIGLTGYKNSHTGLWIVLLLVPYYFYFLHTAISNSTIDILLHFLAPIAALFIKTTTTAKVMMLFVIGLYIIFSFRNTLTDLIQPKTFVALATVFLLIETLHTKNDWIGLYLTVGLVYLVCYLVFYFLSQYADFIQLNNCSASNIPEKEIFRFGLKHTGLFTLLGLVIVLPIVALNMFSGISTALKDSFLGLLKKFIFWMQTFEQAEGSLNAEKAANKTLELDLVQSNPTSGKLAQLWQIIGQILPTLAMILLAVGIIFLFVFVFKMIKKNFHWTRRKKDAQIMSNNDLREQCEIEAIRTDKTSIPIFENNRMKVRKLYKKRVLKAKSKLIGNKNVKELEYMTAKECCEKLSEENLNCIYEKAKYSPEEITSADVKLAKNIK